MNLPRTEFNRLLAYVFFIILPDSYKRIEILRARNHGLYCNNILVLMVYSLKNGRIEERSDIATRIWKWHTIEFNDTCLLFNNFHSQFRLLLLVLFIEVNGGHRRFIYSRIFMVPRNRRYINTVDFQSVDARTWLGLG